MRVGFVGAGAITWRHLGVLAKRGDVEVVAVCDLDMQRAQTAADLTGATAHAEWQSMLDQKRLVALFVCTPPESHTEPAVAAIQLGLPVYVKKPVEEIVAARERGMTVRRGLPAQPAVRAVGSGGPRRSSLRDDAAASHPRRPGTLLEGLAGGALDTYASDHCHLRLDRDKTP